MLKTTLALLRYTLFAMNDDDEVTFSDREIVLEFFPATNKRLVPKPKRYSLEDIGNGSLKIHHLEFEKNIILTAIERSGNRGTLMSCDLCHHSAPRSYMLVYRANVPSSKNFRYLSLCSNRKNCEERRISHTTLPIFERLFEN